jgi:hypothetical protein
LIIVIKKSEFSENVKSMPWMAALTFENNITHSFSSEPKTKGA